MKSLSYLLAGEDPNDEADEWSESMATPPRKWDEEGRGNPPLLSVVFISALLCKHCWQMLIMSGMVLRELGIV